MVSLGDSWLKGIKYLMLFVLGVAFIVFGNVDSLLSLVGKEGSTVIVHVLYGVGWGYGWLVIAIITQRDLQLGRQWQILIYMLYFLGFTAYWIWAMWQSFAAKMFSVLVGVVLITVVVVKTLVSIFH